MVETKEKKQSLWLCALGALGVVYGDIGTSPLYAIRECFHHSHGLALNPENVLGILSLILWTLILVVCLKYMAFVLRADNRGEGGILALMALATAKDSDKSRLKNWLLVPLGLFGAALLFGDGIITPAITVLSAVEGLHIVTPAFDRFVIPLAIIILILLFLCQRFGTGKIGFFFGPIITIWFLSLAALGINGILQNPAVIEAVNPIHAATFFMENGVLGFFVLSAIFLVVTGGEALYADMGHFGRRPIQLAWFWIVFPSLVLNYFGQGALLLRDPSAIQNPFFLLAPQEFVLPLVILATMASVIASQALISGIFSIARQAVQLGYSPRIRIVHTSSREIGQIYVPFVNWVMLIGVIWVVFSFKSSSALAAAYGIAVAATTTVTTLLLASVAIRIWAWKWGACAAFVVVFLTIDVVFLAASAVKFLDGGWVPLVIAICVYLLLSTWQSGRKILGSYLKAQSMPIDEFNQLIETKKPMRVQGQAIYMTGDPWGVPVALLHNLKHNKVLHELTAILTIATKEIPVVDGVDKVKIELVGPNVYRIFASYGFMEMPKIQDILRICKEKGINFDTAETTFVLGRETILPSANPGMSIWREKLFAVMARNALKPTAFFDIPPNQVIEVGIQVEI
jgi:KUP system potassium uptake protein